MAKYKLGQKVEYIIPGAILVGDIIGYDQEHEAYLVTGECFMRTIKQYGRMIRKGGQIFIPNLGKKYPPTTHAGWINARRIVKVLIDSREESKKEDTALSSDMKYTRDFFYGRQIKLEEESSPPVKNRPFEFL